MDNVPQPPPPVTYDALCQDIRAATGWLRLQLIQDAKRLIREGAFDGKGSGGSAAPGRGRRSGSD